MKIIRFGPAKEWTGKYKCTGSGNGGGGCGAMLEVAKSDLFHTQSSDYGGGTDHFVTFECIICKTWTDVKGAPVDWDKLRTRCPR
jgi:hypothetical protein